MRVITARSGGGVGNEHANRSATQNITTLAAGHASAHGVRVVRLEAGTPALT